VIARFSQLGARVSEAWRARRRDERAFPEIARTALEWAALDRTYDFDALAQALAVADPLPRQNVADESFGQPPVTVFQGDGFFIEVLFWTDGAVAIHQHGFSGAFSVFEGSSVHTRHRFTETKRINSAVLLGELSFVDAELLVRGDVREIPAGPELIHTTFHLDRPTVSIVVRTHSEHLGQPQYSYLPPGLAFDPFPARPTMQKRLQILRGLHRTRRETYWRTTESLLAVADWHMTYLVLDQVYMLCESAEDRARVCGMARAAHGDEIDVLVPVLEATAAQRFLTGRRDSETDEELRFVLGVVLAVPSRPKILELVARRFPGEEAPAVALRCLKKLGFDDDALVLGGAILAVGSDRGALKARLARAEVGFANDYALLKAVRTLREVPGLAALLT